MFKKVLGTQHLVVKIQNISLQVKTSSGAVVSAVKNNKLSAFCTANDDREESYNNKLTASIYLLLYVSGEQLSSYHFSVF